MKTEQGLGATAFAATVMNGLDDTAAAELVGMLLLILSALARTRFARQKNEGA